MQWTLSTLKDSLAFWVENDEPSFLDARETLIALAERRLYRDLNLTLFDKRWTERFKAGQAEQFKPTPGEGSFVATRALDVTDYDSQTYPLEPRSYDFVRGYNHPFFDAGRPKYFCDLSETQWLIAPVPEVRFQYTAHMQTTPPGLKDDGNATWLSSHCPDTLFYACLVACEEFLKADERIAVWNAKYVNELLPAARRELSVVMRADYRPGLSQIGG